MTNYTISVINIIVITLNIIISILEFNISVYETKSLYDHCLSEYNDGWRAKKRAETFIEGALNRWGYSVNFEDTTDHIANPGTEKRDETFSDDCTLCDPQGIDCTYRVLGWFKEWVECGRPVGDQSSILLSNTSSPSGGRAYRNGKHAHGPYSPELHLSAVLSGRHFDEGERLEVDQSTSGSQLV